MLLKDVRKEDIRINNLNIYIKDVDISGSIKVNIYKDSEIIYQWFRVNSSKYRQEDGSYVIPNKVLDKDIEGELYIDNCQPIEVNLIEFINASITNKPLIASIRVAIKDRPILYFSPIYMMRVISINRILINDIYIDIPELLGIKTCSSFNEETLGIWMKKGTPVINEWLDIGINSGLNRIVDSIINSYTNRDYLVKIYYE